MTSPPRAVGQRSGFEQCFGYPPESEASAPGRVNLLGEHTDYNDGLVLPTIIPQRTHVALAASRDGEDRFRSAQLAIDEGPSFGRYIRGCIEALRAHGASVPPVHVYVDSDVPIGAGLSSSAALEVATLRALRMRFAVPLDDVELARLAQRAEVDYVGVRCGIMDQMASSVGVPGFMLLLDTQSLERSLLPIPADAAILVIDSGVQRELASSGYNERRAECERAARLLGLRSLRELDDAAVVVRLPEPLNRRVRHVVSENARVRQAAAGVDAALFGRLMNASHESLRLDFEVSVPALDQLVHNLQLQPGVYGAKLTGAGFGGAVVALVDPGRSDAITRAVLTQHGVPDPRPRRLV